MTYEMILHSAPVGLALLSFWSNTEKKLLLINLGLCITIASLMALQSAWSGVVVMSVAGMSTSYRLLTQQLVNRRLTGILIVLMAALIGYINLRTGKTGWLELLPLLTFILYRFGELHCREAGLRLCMISGSLLFAAYALVNQTWGVVITETLFAVSNSWFYLGLLRQHRRTAW